MEVQNPGIPALPLATVSCPGATPT
jgi:hypothetical protein